MTNCPKHEQILLKSKMANKFFMAEYYPDIVRFHQNELLSYFDSVNTGYLAERKERTGAINTKEQAYEYILEVKARFRHCVGEIKALSEVGHTVVDTLDKGDYLIDKVLIESCPGYYLTADFYYPAKISGKIPGILLLSGHSPKGKAFFMQVSFCMEAVYNGFCVLAFDPVGHGERMMYHLEDAPFFESGNPDYVHYLAGQKAWLTGDSLTRYMMLDNVRALDYLCAREEVDISRLAVTGNSGGGQMSAFMGAYDDRLAAVAPSCYITELRSMIYNIGAQEPEQSPYDFMKLGLDHADLIIAAAPKPYFIGSALTDYFPIDGTRDSYIEARRIYRLMEAEENLEIYTAPKPHGFWHDTRKSILEFLCRQFAVPFIADKKIDYDCALPCEDELNCTESGDINHVNSISLHQMIQYEAERKYPPKPVLSSGEELYRYKESVVQKVLSLLQLRGESLKACNVKWEGSILRGNYTVQRVSFFSETYMKIYGTLYSREDRNNNSVLFHTGEIESDKALEKFLEEFSAVFCIEPRGTGTGAVEPGSWFYTGDAVINEEASYNCNAAMLGKSVLGMRVRDVLCGLEVLRDKLEMNAGNPVFYGCEEHALTALFAAVLSNAKEVWLEKLLFSYRDIICSRVHNWSASCFAYGLSGLLDTDDLIMALMPAKIKIRGLLDAMKRPLAPETAAKAFNRVVQSCRQTENGEAIFIE